MPRGIPKNPKPKKDVPAKTKKSPIKGVGPAAVRANEPELGPLLRLSLVNQNIKNLTELAKVQSPYVPSVESVLILAEIGANLELLKSLRQEIFGKSAAEKDAEAFAAAASSLQTAVPDPVQDTFLPAIPVTTSNGTAPIIPG